MDNCFTVRDMEAYGRVIPSAIIYAVEIGDDICHRCNTKMTTEYRQYFFASNYFDNPIFKANVRYCAFCGALFIPDVDYHKNFDRITKSDFQIDFVPPIKKQDFIPRCVYLMRDLLYCVYESSKWYLKKCPYLQNYKACYYYTDNRYKFRTFKESGDENKESICKFKDKKGKCLNTKCDRHNYKCPYSSGANCSHYSIKCGESVKKNKNIIPQYYTPEWTFEPNEYIDWSKQIATIFVYTSFCRCVYSNHTTSQHNAKVFDITGKKVLYLKVLYCKECNRFSAAKNQIDRYVKNRVIPKIRLISTDYTEYNGFRNESDLMLYGYNVKKDGLDEQDRKNLLAAIIDNKLMCSFEIINHLNGLIALHQYDPKWSEAIDKYRDDIAYVNDYKFQNPDAVLKLDE